MKKPIITNLYAVKFGNQGFGAVITAYNDNDVILTFGAAVNDPKELIGQTFHECALYKVGTYNPVLGKVKSFTPILVKRGIDIKLPDEVNEETEFDKDVNEFTKQVLADVDKKNSTKSKTKKAVKNEK